MNQQQEPQSGPPHVACLVETSMAFDREILWGVARYLQSTHKGAPLR